MESMDYCWRLLILLSVISAVLESCNAQGAADCPSPGVYVNSRSVCYEAKNLEVHLRRDWATASQECYPGTLATIRNSEEQNAVAGLAQITMTTWATNNNDDAFKGFWIGLTEQQTDWHYTNSTSTSYLWNRDQPNSFNNYQKCGALQGDGLWGLADESCYNLGYGLCEKKNQFSCSIPGVPGQYSFFHGSSCYFLLTNNQYILEKDLSWFAARHRCRGVDADLASGYDQALSDAFNAQEFRNILESDREVWFGLISWEWEWNSGPVLDYTNWVPGEPNSPHDLCGLMQAELRREPDLGYWADYSCAWFLPFICERVNAPCSVANCASCVSWSALQCQTCNTGYSVSQGQCTINAQCSVANCVSCVSWSAFQCQTCNAGYIVSQGQCTISSCTIANCASCYQTQCDVCNSGYFLSGVQCVLSCQVQNCQQCASQTTCSVCFPGFQVVGGVCQTQTNPLQCQLNDFLCEVCDVSNPSRCQTCRGADGIVRYVNLAGSCQVCEVGNCAECEADGRCRSCRPTFTLTSDRSECRGCTDHCAECGLNEVCGQCSSGYYMTSSSTCAFCSVAQCTQCSSSGACQTCNEGYPLRDGKCECVQFCAECRGPGNCAQCSSGYYMTDGICISCNLLYCDTCVSGRCTRCKGSAFLTDLGQCLCSPSCLTCNPDDGRCSSCPQGQWVDNGICRDCSIDGCLRCDGQGCAACGSDLILDNGRCHACDVSDCQVCNTDRSCRTCNPGFLPPVNGVCVCADPDCSVCNSDGSCQICKPGMIKENGICVECTLSQCEVCHNNGTCGQCSGSFNLVNGVCECPVTGCATCDEQGACLTCRNNYNLVNGLCVCTVTDCDQCDPSGNCIDCAGSYLLTNGECTCPTPSCADCSLSGVCTACNPGFELSGTYACLCTRAHCVECHPSGSCAACRDHYKNENGVCVCEVDHCYNCQTNGVCLECAPNFRLDTETGTCVCSSLYCEMCNSDGSCRTCSSPFRNEQGTCKCPDANCAECNINGVCVLCSDPFVLSNGVCGCAASCSECSQEGVCVDCNEGYYLDADSACQACPLTNCDACSAANTCTACASGFNLDNGRCNCGVDNCGTCTPGGNCTDCLPGFFLQPPSDGTCNADPTTFGNDVTERPIQEPNTASLVLFQVTTPIDKRGKLLAWKYYIIGVIGNPVASLVLLRPSLTRTSIYNVIAVTDVTATAIGVQTAEVPASLEIEVQAGDLFGIYSPTRNPIPYSTSGTEVCQTGAFYSVLAPSRLAVGSVLPMSELVTIDCRIYSIQISTEPGCPEFCATCEGTTCLSCVSTHYLSTAQCVECGVKDCASCASDGTCDQCKSGFVKNAQTGECECAAQNCQTCDTNGKCTECAAGFDFIDGVCSCGVADCTTCNSDGTCSACHTGFRLNNGACECNLDNCGECDPSGVCITCLNEFFNNDGACQDAAGRYGNDVTNRQTMDNSLSPAAVLFDVMNPIDGNRVLKRWYYYSTTGTNAPSIQLLIIRPANTSSTTYLVVSSTVASPSATGMNHADVTPPVDIEPGDFFGMYSPDMNPVPYSSSDGGQDLCSGGKFYSVSNPTPLPEGSALPLSQLTTIACRVYSIQVDTDPACTLANCLTCNGDLCTECERKFYLQNDVCQACPQTCAACTDATTCTDCSPGFYHSPENTCQECQATNCQKCNSEGGCESCEKNYVNSGGTCVDAAGVYGNDLLQRPIEDTSSNMLLLFDMVETVTRAAIVESWNYYATRVANGEGLSGVMLMVWRPLSGTAKRYQLIGSVSSTPMNTGVMSMPASVDVAVMPGDILALYWPGTNPIPYALPTNPDQVCVGGDIYSLSNSGIHSVGDIVDISEGFTNLPCRVYSMYIALKDSQYGVGVYGNELLPRAASSSAPEEMVVVMASPEPIRDNGELPSWSYYADKVTGNPEVTLMIWRPDSSGTKRRSARATSAYSLVGQSQDVPTTSDGVNTVSVDPPLTVQPGDIMGLAWNGLNPVPYDTPADGTDACTNSAVLQMQQPRTVMEGESIPSEQFQPLDCRVYSMQSEIKPTPYGPQTYGFAVRPRAGMDLERDMLFIYDTPQAIVVEGIIKSWSYQAQTLDGVSSITMMLWRPVSSPEAGYELVAFKEHSPTAVQAYTLDETTDIVVKQGDLIGVYWKTANPVPYDIPPSTTADSICTDGSLPVKSNPDAWAAGDTLTATSMASVNCRIYSAQVILYQEFTYGYPLKQRSQADTASNLLMIFDHTSDVIQAGYVTSWNYYADDVANSPEVELILWRPDATSSEFTLVALAAHTPTASGIVRIPETSVVRAEPGDVLGFLVHGSNPIWYDTDQMSPGNCSGMSLLYTSIASVAVGDVMAATSLTPLACRVYSIQVQIRPTMDSPDLTTPATTVEPTTAEDNVTSGSGNGGTDGGPPSAGASTGESSSSLSTFEILIIVMIAMLVILLIVACCLFVHYRKQTKESGKTSPVFDGRQQANRAECETIYIHPKACKPTAGLLDDPAVYSSVPTQGNYYKSETNKYATTKLYVD